MDKYFDPYGDKSLDILNFTALIKQALLSMNSRPNILKPSCSEVLPANLNG